MTPFKTSIISRRAFMGGLTASVMTPALARAQLSANPDVIVIGAGAAGLGAARKLIDEGHEVTLIEAADRIGGRAHTDMTTFGVPYDIGAHWLHTDSRNPFNEYGRENGFDIYRAPDEWRVFVETREVDGDGLWRTWDQMYDAIGDKAERGFDISAAKATENVSGDWAATAAFAIGPWSMAKDLEDFSITDWWSGADGSDYYCREGFGTLVAHYGAGIPVSLGTTATAIDWSGDGVSVETNKGTLRAKAVIVTVSTGVLASGAISFTPTLPAAKLESFQDISMGLYNHIALQFSRDVFELGEDGYLFYQIGDDGKGFGTLTNAGGHGLAYCDVGGSWAEELERQSVEARIDYALSKLRALLGSGVDSAFVKGDATSWGQNPLTLGSYASAIPGSASRRRDLRAEVGDRIFFAGEACSPDLWATVAGALKSGQSVARDVARTI